jgi:uncharacterized protein YraI
MGNMKTSLVVGALLLGSGSALAETTATAMTELNIRSGPAVTFEVVGVIPADGEITITGCGDDGFWCQVEYQGVEGWASGGYLAVTPEIASEPVIIMERRTEVEVPVIAYENHAPEQAVVGLGSGAAAGALVGGPIGAAVGGAAGAALGALANVPEPVVSYVREHRQETVILDGEVVVGAEIPDTVELQPVPETDFRYTTINHVPVIVDPDGRRIIRIVR